MRRDATEVVIARAMEVEGLSADPADPDRRAAYLAVIAYGETPARAAGMAELSGCGLVAGGILARVLVVDLEVALPPELAPPYRTASAVSRLVALARRCDAWRPYTFPRPGWISVIEGPEHVLTCIARTDTEVESIDGGQRDARGFECIRRRARNLSGSSIGGRPLFGSIDTAALFEQLAPGAGGGSGGAIARTIGGSTVVGAVTGAVSGALAARRGHRAAGALKGAAIGGAAGIVGGALGAMVG